MLIRKIYTYFKDFDDGIPSPEVTYSNLNNKLYLLLEPFEFLK